MIIYPSFREIAGALRTKIKGKIPTVKVIEKLISRAARALSLPCATETKTDSSMNRALTRRAKPTFREITLRFILGVFQIFDPAP